MSKTEKQLIEVLEQLTRAIDANTAATRLLADAMVLPQEGREMPDGSAGQHEDRLITEPEVEAQPDM